MCHPGVRRRTSEIASRTLTIIASQTVTIAAFLAFAILCCCFLVEAPLFSRFRSMSAFDGWFKDGLHRIHYAALENDYERVKEQLDKGVN